MSRNLPSPIALRAFESAARHLSFTRAAQELFVSQSAVSHQVRGLERELGVRLFLRLTRQLRLTDDGANLLAVLRDSFDRIEATVKKLKTGSASHPLRISLTSYFAARWLTRRLSLFSATHPELEIHLHLVNDEADFKRMDLDLAIVWGTDNWPELETELLMPLNITAVCSPSLANSGPALQKIADLKNHCLLHESGREFWKTWFDSAGHEHIKPARHLVMDDANVLHQAAIEGQGVALGATALLEDELSRGVLTQPFKHSVSLGGYYIVHPAGARNRPNVSAFCDWLIHEATLAK
jgi:LysR family transcriptional regulator, glycine cleavage system transcriptional activator